MYQILDGIRLTYIGLLRGALRTKEALATSALAFWGIGIPLAAGLIYGGGFGALSLPVALTVGMIVGTVTIAKISKKGTQKT